MSPEMADTQISHLRPASECRRTRVQEAVETAPDGPSENPPTGMAPTRPPLAKCYWISRSGQVRSGQVYYSAEV
jgi:hypothetical protein